MVAIKFDGRECEAAEGQTILEAASDNGVYIPTLCAHPSLMFEGSCRICMVKIEGRPGFSPACSTPVTPDMEVITADDELKRLRTGVLELILAAHPSACLVCRERKECFDFNREPSKAGVTTGCRFCPNRDKCELFDVAEKIGLDAVRIPMDYKNAPIYREDFFIQRDYNLCINCGRCVRACRELRGLDILSFMDRGYDAIIGTPDDRPLQDSGCIFCGACVDVCPTGTLSEQNTRWGGEPEGTGTTVCNLCSVGCTLNIDYRWDALLNARPDPDGVVNKGQACVFGRFCIPTLMNSQERLRFPRVRKDGGLAPVEWEEALTMVKERLGGYDPAEVGFLASPDLTNEGAFAFQKYARNVIGTPNIDVISGLLRPVLNTMVRTGAPFLTIDELGDMEMIIQLGGDPLHTHPALTVPMVRARDKGAHIVHVTREKCPGCLADEHHPVGSINDWCDKLFAMVRGPKAAVLFGEEILEDYPEDILEVALASGAGLMPLFAGCNALGTAGVGCMAGSLIGHQGTDAGFTYPRMTRNVRALVTTQGVPESLGDVEFIVLVDILPSDTMDRADVVLPAAAFTETSGTVTNLERRVQAFDGMVDPPGMARPDWEIFSTLGEFGYSTAEDVAKEYMGLLHMEGPGLWSPGPSTIKKVKPERYGILPPRHRGALLSDRIPELDVMFRKWGVIR